MKNNPYKLEKRVNDLGQTTFVLIKNNEVIFTTFNRGDIDEIIDFSAKNVPSQEEVLQSIEEIYLRWEEEKKENEAGLYHRPSTLIDNFIILFIILNILGFGYFLLNSGVVLTFGVGLIYLLLSIFFFSFNMTVLIAIVNSRVNDRKLMNRLDEIEKKLDLYKKPSDNK